MSSLKTSIKLPFRVYVSELVGEVTCGGDVRVRCELASDNDVPAVVDEVGEMLATFVILAGTGALAGSGIRPADSDVERVDCTSGNVPAWTLRGCRIDPGAVVVLVNWFSSLACRPKIKAVFVGDSPLKELPYGPSSSYPGVFESPEIRIFLPEMIGEDFQLLMAPERVLTAENESSLFNCLATCATALAMGAFASDSRVSGPFSCQISEGLEHIVDELSFPVWRFRCDRAGALALVNAAVSWLQFNKIDARLTIES